MCWIGVGQNTKNKLKWIQSECVGVQAWKTTVKQQVTNGKVTELSGNENVSYVAVRLCARFPSKTW